MPQNSNLLFHNRFAARIQVAQLNLNQNGKEKTHANIVLTKHRLQQVYTTRSTNMAVSTKEPQEKFEKGVTDTG